MGSQTHEEYEQQRNGGGGGNTAAKPAIVAKPQNGTFPNDDLGGSDDEGDDDDDADSKAAIGLNNNAGNTDKKKKRKRSKKKKTGAGAIKQQSSPPRVLLSNLFPSGEYPTGELKSYDENLDRVTGEEQRHNDRMDSTFLSDYRQAAEVHRQVRQHAQTIVKPGKSLTDIAVEIEDGVRALIGHQGLETGDSLIAGMGFPTGLALNHCAAHFTPNPGQKDVILKYDDVLKVDFGVHINGRIVDSAFTMAFDPTYDNLLAAVKDATNTGVAAAGIDARMKDIGAAIQEVMESYEVKIKGKTYPVKAIRSLTGHNIEQYHIHGDKQVPFVKNNSQQKMEEGDVFAIETFGTTGRGYMRDDVGVYGYGRNEEVSTSSIRDPSARALLKIIDENFGTIVFCRRYLERLGVKQYLPAMRILINSGAIESYAPLIDIKGSYTAQFEHTVLLRSSCKEIISRGEDY